MKKGEKVKVIDHWCRALIGMEGTLTEKSIYNGNTFYKLIVTTDGPKYNKINLAWNKGNKTWILDKYLSSI